MSRLKLMGADPTCDQINDWFKIGTNVQVATIRQSKLGGRPLDPDTGEAAEISFRKVMPSYKKNAALSNEEQLQYAEYYQRQEEMAIAQQMHGPLGARRYDDDGIVSSASGLENVHDTLSTMTAAPRHNVELPQGMTEEDAVRVYSNYNLRHTYDARLPITSYRQDIVDQIESQPVTIVMGATGSGKTTQVPQYILDHYAAWGRYCNIVVTQPRRIAAVSIARRVCAERNWQLGRICGYQIGLEAQVSEDTRLLYCTTGVLLQRLVHDKNMCKITHVILDEVHERDMDLDFCLLLVRKYLRSNSMGVKVVLMSATIDCDLFAKYFSVSLRGNLEKAPVLAIEGRTYDVAEYYLDDLRTLGPLPCLDADKPDFTMEAVDIAVKLIASFDDIENSSDMRGSVLVFLPGLEEINQTYNKLQKQKFSRTLLIRPLHSTITNEEQVKVFDQPLTGFRKVILSTNIAESSITVPDIRYVIDFCLTKTNILDPETNYTSLQIQWASKANCQQRKGRAGRVAQGRVYRLVTHRFYMENLPSYCIPDMQRSPLEKLVLNVKVLDIGEPKAVIGLALSPPRLDNIERTIIMLKEVGALASTVSGRMNLYDGDLTALGRVLYRLPVDVRLGKLMVLGHAFGMLEYTIIISASQSVKNFFARPYERPLESFKYRLAWASSSFSDSLSYLYAFLAWQRHTRNSLFPSASHELQWGKSHFIQIRRIKEVDKLVTELKGRLRECNILTPSGPNYREPDMQDPNNQLILKLLLCGAFYPHYFEEVPADEEVADREMSGYNPETTVIVKGLPQNQGALYRHDIENLFVNLCQCQKPRVHFEETRAFVEFIRDPTENLKTRVIPDVYVALKLRQLGKPLEVQLVDPDIAWQQMSQMSLSQDHRKLRSHRVEDGHLQTVAPASVGLHPPQQEFFPITITTILGCGRFWAHNVGHDTTECMQILLPKIQHYVVAAEELGVKSKFKPGDLCLAPYTDTTDGSTYYYRGRVEKLAGTDVQKVQVFFVDYGNFSDIPTAHLYPMHDSFLSVPFQAFECELCKLKPSAIKCPAGQWTVEADRCFEYFVTKSRRLYMSIFSVVHNVLRVELFREIDGVEKKINQELIRLNFADEAEENFLSLQSHQQREQASVRTPDVLSRMSDAKQTSICDTVSLMRPLPNGNQRLAGKVTLKGPWSAYEVGFTCCTFTGKRRPARIERDSVNSIALSDGPSGTSRCSKDDKMTRMMVASHVTLNSDLNLIIARDTTLMPPIDGLLAIVSLLFAPLAELRCDSNKTRFTGVLCGLGCNTSSPDRDSIFPDHDMELPFNFHFDIEDLSLINRVRQAINLAACKQYGVDAVLKIQRHARNNLLALIKKPRERLTPMPFQQQYRWCQVDEENVCHPVIEDGETFAIQATEQLYQMHCGIVLATDANDDLGSTVDDPCYQMSRGERMSHQSWLASKASRSTESEDIHCRLCDVMLHTPQELLLHLSSVMHRKNQPV